MSAENDTIKSLAPMLDSFGKQFPETQGMSLCVGVRACVCVCVCERERERERETVCANVFECMRAHALVKVFNFRTCAWPLCSVAFFFCFFFPVPSSTSLWGV